MEISKVFDAETFGGFPKEISTKDLMESLDIISVTYFLEMLSEKVSTKTQYLKKSLDAFLWELLDGLLVVY